MILNGFSMLGFAHSGTGTAANTNDGTLTLLMIIFGVLAFLAAMIWLQYPLVSKAIHWLSLIPAGLKALLSGKASPSEAAALDQFVAAGGYAFDAGQNIFYSRIDSWQRLIGYCRLYDEAAAPSGMIIDCEPVYFEYGGKKWLIEFWKGQYDLMTGCEAGIYYTTRPDFNIPGIFRGTFYDCVDDDDMLEMECVLYKKGRKLLSRKAKHWWLTGFVLAEFSEPSELTMDFRCTFKDAAMRDSFVEALLELGYQRSELSIRGNTVALTFSRTHSPQPYTRTAELERITQAKNKYLCDRFNDITNAYKTLPEKMGAVRKQAPDVYDKATLIRGGEKMLKIYKTLSGFSGLPPLKAK